MHANIALLPGDGIGPEVTHAAVTVLDSIAKKYRHQFQFKERQIGGCAIDTEGTAISETTLGECRAADAVLLGAVGGPNWDDPNATVRPEQGLLALRKDMGVFANIRPVWVHTDLLSASPLKPELLADVDIIVVRELTGGLYFGEPKGQDTQNGTRRAFDTLIYHDFEVERIVDMAFRLAQGRRKKVTSVDKANVLASSRLWRTVTNEVALHYPDIVLEHMLVDTAAMKLLTNPSALDVVVTENMFGDILTDEASVLAGSMGLLPSASLGTEKKGLYEPIHGSAPDIAGKGIANPIGTILSVAMMLRFSFGLEKEAVSIENAIHLALSAGCRTPDLGGKHSTQQMTEAIIKNL